MLLRGVHEGAERLAQRRVPLSVVDQLAEGDGQLLLLVHGLFVQAQRLQILVRGVDDGPARRLVHAAALHADEPVFHDVQQADAVGPADLVELEDDVLDAHGLAVEGRGHALLEIERDICRRIRRVQRGDAHLQEAGLFIERLVARVLQVEALVAQVPEVLVLGVVRLAVYLQRHVVRLGVGYLLLAGLYVPLAPGGDDGQLGREVLERELKAHLVVALARAAVADGVRALGDGYLRQALGDGRAGQRRAQQVILILGPGLDGGHQEVVHEFVRQVLHIELAGAGI